MLQGHTGQCVALSADGTTMAVGAPHEAGGSPGINGNQRDNSLFDAGAVYVFTRKGERWVQKAYIKASNTGAGGSISDRRPAGGGASAALTTFAGA